MYVDDGEELKSSSDLLQNYFFVLAVLMLLHRVCYNFFFEESYISSENMIYTFYKNFPRGIIYFQQKHVLYNIMKKH